ncbi:MULTISPECIES: hypothetical protein [unclassified Nocardioides]|uniref:hypothetical protein n=1 Tax=unclassified Nocardioides TaxID=2615069 RepID=UPI0009F092D7|nr:MULTISPECIES: hypothetical protein [unclassified Nocardioides]GAW50607.1 Phage minor structural protein [Nocardioides sp. PD653-B2]GAW57585.1 Phage minor structural protein [Nocardioides sp. PD653]
MQTTSQGNPFTDRLTADQRAVLESIRSRSIDRFGFDAFRMEGDGDGGDGSGDGDQGGDGSDSGATDDGKKGDQQDAGDQKTDDKDAAEGKVEDLPDWAQRIIRDTRADAAKARTEGKQKAAQEAENAVVQRLGKALGLIKDGDKDKVDPAELAKQAEAAQSKARQAQVELALYRSASKNNADPDLLAAVLTHQGKLADLDISDEKFQDKVDAIVKKAVDDNPKLAATQAAGSSSADHAGGSGSGGGKPKSLEEAIAGRMS